MFILCCLTIFPINVNATGGALRKSTIKTCPNEITYRLHSDGNGGTHWHIAITNGKIYYSDGEAIHYDPCPSSNKNEGTAGSTNGGSNNSSNNTNDNSHNTNTRTNDDNYNSNTKTNDNNINNTDIPEEKNLQKYKKPNRQKRKKVEIIP